jgi:hypothetical protein
MSSLTLVPLFDLERALSGTSTGRHISRHQRRYQLVLLGGSVSPNISNGGYRNVGKVAVTHRLNPFLGRGGVMARKSLGDETSGGAR